MKMERLVKKTKLEQLSLKTLPEMMLLTAKPQQPLLVIRVKTMLRDNKTLGYLVQQSGKLHNKKAPVLILTDGSNQLNR